MDAQLHISTDEEIISPVCDFTYSWCLNGGLPREEAVRFTIAVSELITDIILFAYPRHSRATFDISFKRTLTNLELVVSEAGEPFDPDRHRYNEKRAREEGDFEGAGFRLIRRFCDDFLFINKGKEGKEFRLTKNLEVEDIDILLEQAPSRQEAELELADEPAEEVPQEEFSVGRIRVDDAEDIAKLIYRTYGYSYPKEDLYYPKKIEKVVLGKEKLGAIARRGDGEAVGYFAVLRKDDSNIAEVGEAVVSPEYRRRGLMGRMMRHLIEIARNQNLSGLYGKAVTIHPVSQKVNHRYGFKSTALMLADTNTVFIKGFEEDYKEPISAMIDFLHLKRPAEKTFYVPDPYRKIMADTLDNLELLFSYRKPNQYKLARKSDVAIAINYIDMTALIVVKKYGSDFRQVLSGMLESLQNQEKLNAIYMDLPLENVATPGEYEKVKDKGFIYCGLVPLFHDDADYLRLQKISAQLNFDRIEAYSDFGMKIKRFVQDEYHRHT